ncbi:MAG TPA: trypsin-like peptidase domain-containing protein [Aliidongia sp.]|nr:trypsin-like peptidase domain-containing protein [Aliidongia sp.]
MRTNDKPRQVRRTAILLGLSTALAFGPLAPVLAQAADGNGAAGVETLPSFAPIVDKVLPAVVNISVEQRQAAPVDDEDQGDDQGGQDDGDGNGGPGFNGPAPGTPFDQLLRRFFEQQQPGFQGHQSQPQQRQHVMALGSGFIIDPSGYVVTNNHVVGNADKVTVIFQDNSRHVAKIVGKDAKSDLALLKIDAPKPLPYVEWGDSDKARVGDWILAVGNPFGLGGTVTKGIISSHSRSLGGSYVDYMQVDASVNRGNSGGPTFDLNGRVVGINTAIYSPNGGNVGIAFDIPSDTAKTVIDELKATGHVDRGWLGVQIQQVTPEIASAIGEDASSPKGALVAAIDPKGPAAKSGLEVGDVIQKFGGKRIDKVNDLPHFVGETKAGESVKLAVLRQGKEVDVDIRVGHLDETQVASNDSGGEASKTAALGVTLTKLNPEIRQRLKLGKDASGALISRVAQDSPAANAGLEAGDVIQQINGQKIGGPDEASEKVAMAAKDKDKPLLLLVNRHGTESFIAVPLNDGGQG